MAKLRKDLTTQDLVNFSFGLHRILPQHQNYAVIGIEQALPEDQNMVMHLMKIGSDPGDENNKKILMLSYEYILRYFDIFTENEEENEVQDTEE